MIQINSSWLHGKIDLLRNELKMSGVVEEIAESSAHLTRNGSNNSAFDWAGKDAGLQANIATIWVAHEFGKTINWQIKEGRDFSQEFSADSSAIIINEAVVKFTSIADPVGKEIIYNGKKFHIVGVVKDMITGSPYSPVKQTIYLLDDNRVSWINLKLNPEKTVSESLIIIESILKKNIPAAPFDYEFADQEYARKFSAEERIGKLASVFAALAIFICCLGLFGLAAYVAEQRTKEIGLRKILGASVINLWLMLSKDFVLLVIISIGIAVPVAYYLMNEWLQKYEYRTPMAWWTFVIAGAGALLITFFTVSYQSIKTALTNPVKSLRSE